MVLTVLNGVISIQEYCEISLEAPILENTKLIFLRSISSKSTQKGIRTPTSHLLLLIKILKTYL
jgi:hypothetical protein